jgi:hypothetical protein
MADFRNGKITVNRLFLSIFWRTLIEVFVDVLKTDIVFL